MSALISSIVAFILGSLAILGLVPHQQIQPIPQLPQQGVPQSVNVSPPSSASAQVVDNNNGAMIQVDDNFWKNTGGIYYRHYYDYGPKIGTFDYIKVQDADPSTFRLIAQAKNNTGPNLKGEASQSAAYYRDVNRVYYFYDWEGMADSSQYVGVIPAANSSTFEGINIAYSKDDRHVYAMEVCAPDACVKSPHIMEAVDPNHFFALPAIKNVPNPNGSGDISVDAEDGNYWYYRGNTVGQFTNL